LFSQGVYKKACADARVPCVISMQTAIPGSKIFRFENFWVAHHGFMQTVEDSWNKPNHKVNSVANLNAKLKRLRYDLNSGVNPYLGSLFA
jgi:hypothetical protein